jgi:hypothetical protein
MNAKPHRTNSDFQLRYFLAGSCHTPDGAWALMYGQKIDIEGKIKHTHAQKLRRDAKIMAAKDFLANNLDAPLHERMEKEAEIIECEAAAPIAELNLRAAEDELATIERIMAELEPLRKYSHLSLLAANEAAQREEWLGELKTRAENFLLSQGSIPHDQLNTMRNHPDFATELVPHIRQIVVKMKGSPDGLELLARNDPLLRLKDKR